jgi:hypothetical protein
VWGRRGENIPTTANKKYTKQKQKYKHIQIQYLKKMNYAAENQC